MSIQPKIYAAGHRGMVGAVIVRTLEQQDQTYIVTRTHASPHMGDGAQQLVWGCCSQQKGQFND